MATNTKDMETLRAESQQLSSRITRLSIILISALTVVTFTITNALEKVDVRELKRERDAAERATEFNWDFYKIKLAELKNLPPDADREKEKKEEERLRDLWLTSNKKQREIQLKYDALLKESFSINPSILGSNLKFDLRVWIYSIPFIVLIAVIYIQILRKKQKTVSVIAASLLSDNTEAAKFDRLTFSERLGMETSYAKSPSQLELTVYLVITVFLFSYMIVALDDAEVVLLGLSFTNTVQYLLMLLTASFYGVGYYYYIAASLDKQAAALTGWTAEPNFVIKSWRKLQALARNLISRLKPKISLPIGSLLVILSLFLSTSASCDQNGQITRLPGYRLLQEPGGKFWVIKQQDASLDLLERLVKEPSLPPEIIDKSLQEIEDRLLQEPKGGWWISTIVNTKWGGLYWQNSINNLGRYTYALSMVLAVLTLLSVLYSVVRRKGAGLKKVYTFLFLLSMTLALIIIIDFSFNTFWFKDELFLLSNLFWIVPIAFLCRITLSKRENMRAEGARIKPFLITLILPLAACATVYVCYVALDRFIGILVYFVGINLLSLTYLEIVRSDLRNYQAAPEASPKEPPIRGT
jgi:hypothetical protein